MEFIKDLNVGDKVTFEVCDADVDKDQLSDGCAECCFSRSNCSDIACCDYERPDGKNVYFKLLENE